MNVLLDMIERFFKPAHDRISRLHPVIRLALSHALTIFQLLAAIIIAVTLSFLFLLIGLIGVGLAVVAANGVMFVIERALVALGVAS